MIRRLLSWLDRRIDARIASQRDEAARRSEINGWNYLSDQKKRATLDCATPEHRADLLKREEVARWLAAQSS